MTDQDITPSPAAPAASDTARETVLAEAVSIIDGALRQMMQRELVSTGEVADLLLDMRSLLTSAQ